MRDFTTSVDLCYWRTHDHPSWNRAEKAFAQTFRDDPVAALQRFRSLYTSRKTPRIALGSELMSCAIVLGDFFTALDEKMDMDRRHFPIDNPEDIGVPQWRACASSGFPVLLMDMASDDRLFDEEEPWADCILHMLYGVTYVWREQLLPNHFVGPGKPPLPDDTASRFLDRVQPFLANLWKNRQQATRECGELNLRCKTIQNLLRELYKLCINKFQRVDTMKDTKLAHIDILFFAVGSPLHIASPQIVGSGIWGMELFMNLYAQESLRKSGGAGMLERFVTDGIDPERILNAFAVLMGDHGRREMADRQLKHTLHCLTFFITDTSGAYLDAMCSVPLIHSVAMSLQRQERYGIVDYGQDNLEMWSISAMILRTLFDLLVERVDGPKMHGEDVLYILTRGINLCASYVKFPGLKLDTRKLLKDMLGALSENVTLWRQAVQDSITEESSTINEVVLEQLRESARLNWYPSLSDLRDTQKELESISSPATTSIIRNWEQLGRHLGCDEITERKRVEGQRRRMCAWSSCKYHRMPAPASLRSCGGCGERKYCSTECQRSDWKEGGHKSRCRRIKSA
ncbi:hypothetical protein PENSPDRAFT_646603 [Peniophora sp. CONT]|nr:hypothetical protein PENSPDRAFT_646603 [Peniophora sp. CONT]